MFKQIVGAGRYATTILIERRRASRIKALGSAIPKWRFLTALRLERRGQKPLAREDTRMRLTFALRVFLSLAVFAPAAPAFADIAAYNAAMKAGDYKAAAAQTTTIWSGFDKTSSDAAGVAREFGFANLSSVSSP